MSSDPRHDDLTDRTENLSRFESEGGSSEHVEYGDGNAEPRARGLQVAEADHRGRVLVAYAAREPHTHAIADALAIRLRDHGFAVEIGDATSGTMPPPEDYDAVILGLPMTFGRESELIGAYVVHHREALEDVATALFTVSNSGSVRDHDPGGFLEQFLLSVAWLPDLAAAFAGGEPFPREGVLRRLAVWAGEGRPTRASIRTDWTDVDDLANALAAELADVASRGERSAPRDRARS